MPFAISFSYMASIWGLYTSFPMFLFSLNVGVRMLFSTENGSSVKKTSLGLSSPVSLFSVAILIMSSMTTFFHSGSLTSSEFDPFFSTDEVC